ncbi:hypothetical protein ID866_12157, partial [Astraeus odoratus]
MFHGIKGSRDTHIMCPWDGCERVMARHNFVRHMRERHLGFERRGN